MPEFHGKVVRKLTAAGSKSEREAVVLEAGGRVFVLRREGGNPFNDSGLDDLVGKSVRVEGDLLGGYTILIKDLTVE